MPKVATGLLLQVLPLLTASPFVWKDHNDGRLELQENGKTALVYNYGPQLKAGVPEDRRRCCYLFPVLTPAGVSVLDDFAKDHYHHRGLFWAWPEVETGGTVYDLWMMKDIGHRLEPKSLHWSEGSLSAGTGWYTGDKRIVKETVEVTVLPARARTRTVDVRLTFEALDAPVTLRGAHDANKSYGGFSARFAPRANTVLRTDEGVLTKNDDLHPHRWAELEAAYEGKRAVLRITPDTANPGLPYQWCLREYGFVGASFPGKTDKVSSYTIQPGKPLKLRFQVQLSDR
ncbi:MAG: PmoA family protein [Acidobacteria bacterium]|nr:PmoA family protein [Acidobacteriota bacterium]